MTVPLIPFPAGLWSIVSGLLAVLGPIPELGLIVQFAGLGALLGTLAARLQDRRIGQPDGDRRFVTITRWTFAAVLIAVIIISVQSGLQLLFDR